jgi:hypothetical protein
MAHPVLMVISVPLAMVVVALKVRVLSWKPVNPSKELIF